MSFQTICPATGKVKKTYEFSTAEQIEASLKKLNHSFLSWKNLSPAERQKKLIPLVRRMNERADEMALLMAQEMGKPIKEAKLEVKKCIQAVTYFCELDISFLSGRMEHSIYPQSQISYEPLGVIFSIMPWNFPLWQVIRMVMPALISGNVILLKHSEVTPLMGKLIEELLVDLYLEPILIHEMTEHSQTEKIIADKRVGGVSLTGSVNSGKTIAELASRYFKKCVLELGGSDPYIVLEDADLLQAAATITRSRFINTGQSCIAAKRCLVHQSCVESLLKYLSAEFAKYQFGDPENPKTDLGPLAHPRFKKGLLEQTGSFLKNTEAKLIYSQPHRQSEESAFVDASIYFLKQNSEWLKDQEFFAPVLVVIAFANESEAIEIANSTDFALGAAIFSKDKDKAKKVASQIQAGQIAVNDFIKSDVTLPFGGFKKSGMGRELGHEGFFEFTQTKVISS